MKRLLLLTLIGLVGIGCYSEAEKAAIQKRQELIERYNVKLTELGFNDTKITTSGWAATTARLRIGQKDCIDPEAYGDIMYGTWGDDEGCCMLYPELQGYGFKKVIIIYWLRGSKCVHKDDLTSFKFRPDSNKTEPEQPEGE